jgi:hypothetical protein
LESSLIRSAHALTRLCCVLAMTTLYFVAQGTEVAKLTLLLNSRTLREW